MKDRIIFHLPFEVNTGVISGTFIRPIKMLQAFKDCGYDVFPIMGSVKERKQRIKDLKKELKSGNSYKFMYSESSTEPTLLTESHHLPLNPWVDFSFFAFVQAQGIPIGLFYRDVYWNFPFYGEGISGIKKWIAKLFYRYDLRAYNKYVSVLYLPSLEMISAIPVKMKITVEALPPAVNLYQNISETGPEITSSDVLKIIYVGGIGVLYRIGLLFEAVAGRKNVELTVCCREQEWQSNSSLYKKFNNSSNIQIVHKSGAELIELFNNHDVVSLFIEPSEYRKFAMPIKLFEYMEHLKPIISSANNAVASFVQENDIGWVIDYNLKEIQQLLDQISSDKRIIDEKAENIKKVLPLHTWKRRALRVAETLMEKQ